MRILHLDSARTWGGGQRQVLHLMEGLRVAGVDQMLVAPPDAPLPVRARAVGLPVASVHLGRGGAVGGAWRMIRQIEPGAQDILHAHSGQAHTVAMVVKGLRRPPRPRLVVTRRVAASIHRHGVAGLKRIKYVEGVDRILCVSQVIRDVLLEDGIPPTLLDVVPSGVDVARLEASPQPDDALREDLGLPPTGPVIGAVGVVEEHKGHADLLAAAPQVLARHPEACFVVLGEGAQRERLADDARALGIADRFRLPGFREDVPTCLRLFDVFAFPSREEALGVSALEALALRRPVVAARTGGLPEVIEHGVHGLLVPPHDPEALAASIVRLLEDGALARRLAAAGHDRVAACYDVASMVEGTLAAYRAALADAGDAGDAGDAETVS